MSEHAGRADRNEINRLAAEEVSHIPKGELSQNIFRSIFVGVRQAGLAKGIPIGQSLETALDLARRDDPTFEYRYDARWFATRH